MTEMTPGIEEKMSILMQQIMKYHEKSLKELKAMLKS